MEILVELKGCLARHAPPTAENGRFSLEIGSRTMVKDILGQINLAEHFAGLILINGRKGKMSGVLQQGDVLTVFPLVAGG